ncbi:hypothetical protein [Nitrosomonas aestuarii]|nr:hypothetical protein [Nitrosomonas aestuarii]
MKRARINIGEQIAIAIANCPAADFNKWHAGTCSAVSFEKGNANA